MIRSPVGPWHIQGPDSAIFTQEKDGAEGKLHGSRSKTSVIIREKAQRS